MNFDFKDTRMKACQDAFNALDPEKSLVMSHFDLARSTDIKDKDQWKDFLKDVRVSEALNEELQLYKDAQQRKLIQRATSNDKSVGTAQMINALTKAKDSDGNKEGTMFIYTYVPLNANEADSPYATAELTDVLREAGD